MFSDFWNSIFLIFNLYKLFYNESVKNIENVKYYSYKCGVVGQKLLQFLLMHNGFLSPSCKKKFDNVFENCEDHEWLFTYKTYLKDFGHSIYDDFEIMEESKTPIGSGSIGQVYKLYHKTLKKDIALKVKHPNANKMVCTFISNIKIIINLIELFKKINCTILIKDFLNNISIQLDYIKEAKHTIQMRNNFIEEEHIIIPEIHSYSENCILMTYYDGISFNQLEDISIKNKISAELYLFLISSLLNHDFLHCDLHYGNWKITKDHKLLIYDCGIIGSTYDKIVNKKIITSIFNEDYTHIAELIINNYQENKNHKKVNQLLNNITEHKHIPSTDRLAIFLKEAFFLELSFNEDILRCIQGLVMCISIISVNADKLGMLLNKQNNKCREVTICFYYYLIKHLNKYNQLLITLQEWLDEDPSIHQKFNEWLEDSFGHTDVDIFMEVILKNLKI